MKKYINADELVEHLNSTIAMLEREMQGYAFADGMRAAYEVVRDEVAKMPPAEVREVMASAWVPVSERLPEKYGWYLCTLKDNRVNELYYSNGIWLDNAKKHLFDLYDIRSRFTGEIVEPEQESVYWTDWVTAWMPKPEPYRGND